MSFDIAELAAQDTQAIRIVAPGGKPLLAEDGATPATITIYGPGSRQQAQAQADRNARILRMARKNPSARLSPEDEAQETSVFLADLTVSLNGFTYKGGADRAAIEAMFADRKLGWLADLVSKEAGDWANFLPQSAKNSAST